jgi:hypothetical protein
VRIPFQRSAVGIVAALALAVTACGSDNGGGNGGTSSKDPALQLASSVEALNEESFKVEVTMGDLMTATGAVDGPGRAGRMAMSLGMEGQSLDMEVIFTETDMWMNMGDLGTLLGAEKPWMHLDLSQLGGDGFMGLKPGETDFAGTAKMMKAVTNVERVDDTTIRGEIDVTKVEDTVVDEEMLAGQTTLSFTATLDDQGRLTQLEVDLPETQGVSVGTLVVRYYDFGQPVDVSPPPADEVSEAPAQLYQMFPNS